MRLITVIFFALSLSVACSATLTAAEVSSEPRPLIRFAGGAVEFELPRDWIATEVPFGREVHLVLSPERRSNTADAMTGRIWIACHVVGTLGAEDAKLEHTITHRLKAVTHGHGQVVQTHDIRIAGCDGVAVDYTAKHPDGTSIRGSHMLLRAGDKLCELHIVAPDNEYTQVSAAAQAVLRTLVVWDAEMAQEKIVARVGDAASALGTWKAVRSRMYLDGQGKIAIEFDRPMVLSVAANEQASPPRTVRGQFVARGNLLHVTWADGSRLNYRWRIVDGDLLLTDHDGNVSQLRRLVQ